MSTITSAADAANELLKIKKQYLVYLHSWMTGKAAFIFGISGSTIVVFDATSPEPVVKEKWNLSDIKQLKPNLDSVDQFTIEMNNNASSWSVRKSSSWTFSCSLRTRLLADVLKFRKDALGDIEDGVINIICELFVVLKQHAKINLKLA